MFFLMNKNLVYALVGILAVVVVGYLLFIRQNQPAIQPTAETTTQAPVTTTPSEVTVTLAERNDSGESGIATLKEVNGKVVVSLNLTGAPAGVAQPAHIHVGACPEVGAVKYPLTSPTNGVSETTLDVNLAQLRAELPLAINVHKSQAEVKTYVSCGDLSL